MVFKYVGPSGDDVFELANGVKLKKTGFMRDKTSYDYQSCRWTSHFRGTDGQVYRVVSEPNCGFCRTSQIVEVKEGK